MIHHTTILHKLYSTGNFVIQIEIVVNRIKYDFIDCKSEVIFDYSAAFEGGPDQIAPTQ